MSIRNFVRSLTSPRTSPTRAASMEDNDSGSSCSGCDSRPPSPSRSRPPSPTKSCISGEVFAPYSIDEESRPTIKGYLIILRRRYCTLHDRTLKLFNTKEEATPTETQPNPVPKKQITVVGVRDAAELEPGVRASLLKGCYGGQTKGTAAANPAAYEQSLIVTTTKSNFVVIQAETTTEKQRWLQAFNSLNFPSADSEKLYFEDMINREYVPFDAHAAIKFLHKYCHNAVATELMIDRFAKYAESNVDDVEFYVQQIVHLIVNVEIAAPERLVHLLMSMCKATQYVEHLGNCIHLALQLFWLLEAKMQDGDSRVVALCSNLIECIEANVVNQQFDTSDTPVAEVAAVLLSIPGVQQRLSSMESSENTEESKEIEEDSNDQIERLMRWIETERVKRHEYFHEEREFVKSLTDISDRMLAITPVSDRKKALPEELKNMYIPEMAYIPLGRVSDPFCRITRVLPDEGTVFSTHSRAPCLICFEVIEDVINVAGQRRSQNERQLRGQEQASEISSNVQASWFEKICPGLDEAQFIKYFKKFVISGKTVPFTISFPTYNAKDYNSQKPLPMPLSPRDNDVKSESSESHQSVQSEYEDDARCESLQQISSASSHSESDLGSPQRVLSPSCVNDTLNTSTAPATEEERKIFRRSSRTAYEMGLAKIMAENDALGETWEKKKQRIRAASPYGYLSGWNLISLISKSNDDIRQEMFAMQLITQFQEIFRANELPLWLRPYRIISTGKTTGLIETITDAQSLDSLKKTMDYKGLRNHFANTFGSPSSRSFQIAQRKYLHSLVAYSLVCYLLQIKDRHNGNILIDNEGHLVHIDFGFMLGIAPGGSWSFENAPFKLTKEMTEVLGGVQSPVFGDFSKLFACGLLALRKDADRIITLVEVMMHNSTFPCFQGRDVTRELQKLKDRFFLHASTEEVVRYVMKMITTSYKNKWMKRYDQFQRLTNGITP